MSDQVQVASKKVKRRSDLLKIIAIVTMFIDHTGVLLFPEDRIFRTIGRIAFPIFAWLLVQGFVYTSNRFNYGFRFLCFGIIAEIPYSFLNNDMVRETEHWNVMYLLFVGLILLVVVEKSGKLFKNKRSLAGLGMALIAFTIVAFPDVIQYYNQDFALSYGTYGLVMMLIFFWFRNIPILMAVFYVLISFVEPYRTGVYIQAVYYAPEEGYMAAFKSFGMIWERIVAYKDGLSKLEGYFFQARSMMGMALILIFDWVRVPIRLPKYIGYTFYPVHIAILILIRIINGGPLG